MHSIDDLRNYFEGQTCILVEPSLAPEAVAQFTFADGTSIRLHCTDLGHWIEKTVPTGAQYQDLDTLFRDLEHHQYNLSTSDDLFDLIEQEPGSEPSPALVPLVMVTDQTLRIRTPDGREFKASVRNLSAWEQAVCLHPKGPALLARAALDGDMWMSIFRRSSWEPQEYMPDCPEDLRVPWTA